LAGAVASGLERGFSLILNRLNMRHPPVTHACHDIESFFGVHVALSNASICSFKS
jgi:hypothetical protein